MVRQLVFTFFAFEFAFPIFTSVQSFREPCAIHGLTRNCNPSILFRNFCHCGLAYGKAPEKREARRPD